MHANCVLVFLHRQDAVRNLRPWLALVGMPSQPRSKACCPYRTMLVSVRMSVVCCCMRLLAALDGCLECASQLLVGGI